MNKTISLITPEFFEKIIFELEAFSYSIGIGLSLAGKAVDVTSNNVCVISKVHYFDFLASCMYTIYLLSLSLKWVTVLVATTNRNMESGQSHKTTYKMRVKRSERKPFVFIFKLNIVLCDSYQADEIVMEIEEWKQKVPSDSVKSFSRVLLSVLETSIVS